jgi:hypothetical protein
MNNKIVSRRILVCLFFSIFSFNFSIAQFKKTSAESIRPVLEKVIGSATEEFLSIRGDQIPADPGTIQYLSVAEVPSALETKIIGYSGSTSNYWVWESKLLATDDFNELKKVYRQYFNDISGGAIKTVDRKYISSEKYESPVEEMRQCINQFSVSGSEVSNETLTIDLVAENVMFEWIIWLRIYDKKKMFADQ